ncbi:MAG: helix-turn-helix domain-containing protein [Bacteroidia bacterium]|nr:helix-turn-helix domain-containing protein [Bacteroidia bacterium]MCF8427398.1 helix-turn-helix domain-containing protein [Bacteroidia bacterium]MCF8446126.1 helix-turn-helix domain-containing protein [Bacteroidia bacterium]
MSLAFLIPGLYFIDNLLILNHQLSRYPFAFFLVQILAVFFPPSVYFYVHLLLSHNKKFHQLLALGSFLLLLFILKITYHFYGLNQTEQEQFIANLASENGYPQIVLIYTIGFYAWQLVYFGVLFYDVWSYYRQAQNSFSHFEHLKIDYLKKFMLLLGILSFVLIVSYISLPLPLVDYGILPLIVSIINVFIIFFAVKHKAVFSKSTYLELVIENQTLQINLDTNILPANHQKLTELGLKLEQLLITHKSYQNPDCRLAHLAQLLNEPDYLVSQALNKHFGKSFFELMNELRINDALQLLKGETAKKYTIEAICFEVGFNSRTAFYRAFKKQTGKTPSEYIN